MWTALADRYKSHKLILLFDALISAIIVYLQSLAGNFWLLIPVVIAFAIVTAPLSALIDSNVLYLLKDDKNLYGKQRMWGAVSWGMYLILEFFKIISSNCSYNYEKESQRWCRDGY